MIEPRNAILGKWILNRIQIITFTELGEYPTYEVVAGGKDWKALDPRRLFYCEERPRDSIKTVFEFEEGR